MYPYEDRMRAVELFRRPAHWLGDPAVQQPRRAEHEHRRQSSAPAAPTSLNDNAANADDDPINQAISSTIATAGSSNGYYLYPLGTSETRSNYNIVRTTN